MPLTTTTKSSLESLDPLVGSPDDSNLPSSPSLSLTTKTTSDTTPSGNYPNHLHPVDNPAPTLNSLEENPSAPAPVVTTAAPLTPPNTTITPSKTLTCPPHITPASTTLTPAPFGPPNPLHHHLPHLDTNPHLSLNANHHHQCPTINPRNLKNHRHLKSSPIRKIKKPKHTSDTHHPPILTQSSSPLKSKNITLTQKPS